jgi:deoxyadenosine/deoxycytidine kinase
MYDGGRDATSTPPANTAPMSRASHAPLVIALEGSVGVGKSTVMAALRRTFATREGVVFLDEPVQLWEESGLLAAMYSGQVSRGVFQQCALMTRAGPLLRALHDPSTTAVITERSPWSDAHVFAKQLEGFERAAYELTYAQLMVAMPHDTPLHVLMLSAPIHVLEERVRTRNRASEAHSVNRIFLAHLEAAHRAMLDDSVIASVEAVEIDATVPADEVARRVTEHVVRLLGEVTTTLATNSVIEDELPSCPNCGIIFYPGSESDEA